MSLCFFMIRAFFGGLCHVNRCDAGSRMVLNNLSLTAGSAFNCSTLHFRTLTKIRRRGTQPAILFFEWMNSSGSVSDKDPGYLEDLAKE